MQAAIQLGDQISPGGWLEKGTERDQRWAISTKAKGLRQNLQLVCAGDGMSRALCAVEGGAASYNCPRPAAHDLFGFFCCCFVFTSLG